MAWVYWPLLKFCRTVRGFVLICQEVQRSTPFILNHKTPNTGYYYSGQQLSANLSPKLNCELAFLSITKSIKLWQGCSCQWFSEDYTNIPLSVWLNSEYWFLFKFLSLFVWQWNILLLSECKPKQCMTDAIKSYNLIVKASSFAKGFCYNQIELSHFYFIDNYSYRCLLFQTYHFVIW